MSSVGWRDGGVGAIRAARTPEGKGRPRSRRGARRETSSDGTGSDHTARYSTPRAIKYRYFFVSVDLSPGTPQSDPPAFDAGRDSLGTRPTRGGDETRPPPPSSPFFFRLNIPTSIACLTRGPRRRRHCRPGGERPSLGRGLDSGSSGLRVVGSQRLRRSRLRPSRPHRGRRRETSTTLRNRRRSRRRDPGCRSDRARHGSRSAAAESAQRRHCRPVIPFHFPWAGNRIRLLGFSPRHA